MKGMLLLIAVLTVVLVALLVPNKRPLDTPLALEVDATLDATNHVRTQAAQQRRATAVSPAKTNRDRPHAPSVNTESATGATEVSEPTTAGAELEMSPGRVHSTGEYVSIVAPFELAVAPGTNEPQRLKLLRQSLDLRRTEVSNLVVRVYYAAEAPPDAREFWDSVADPRFQRVQIEIDGVVHPHSLFVNPLWHHGELLGWRISGWTDAEIHSFAKAMRSSD